ncbi:MAG: SIMPL domain-containing protein [Patescibacteria group bacterium]
MENTSRGIAGIICAIIIGASVVGGTFIVANSFYQVKALENVVSVTGSAQQTITSDQVEWTSTFSRNVDAMSLQAGNTQMQADFAAIKSYLHAHNVTDDQITVQPLNVTTVCNDQQNVQYDKNGGVLCSANNASGYNLQQVITIQSPDVQGITTLSNQASADLIAKGLVFNTTDVEYFYSKLSDLKLQMLAAATKNAQQRAQQIVQSTGGTLGKLRTSDEGVFQLTPVNSTEVSDEGEYDTATIQKQITAIVHASFSVE